LSDTKLTGVVPEGRDYRDLKENGQQLAYLVLSDEERTKGFVRPYRTAYEHRGVRPRHPTRELQGTELELKEKFGYVLFEEYPESESPVAGRYWTQKQLRSGCGTVTTMGREIAETYARNPKFYGGTFCAGCGVHLPLEEFVWTGTDEVVGS
jgi:hypothetical protein